MLHSLSFICQAYKKVAFREVKRQASGKHGKCNLATKFPNGLDCITSNFSYKTLIFDPLVKIRYDVQS